MPNNSGGRQGGNRSNSTAVATQAPSDRLVAVTREIDHRLAIVTASAAAGIDATRLKLVALTAFTRVPELMACDPVSIARAIVEAGQLGLEPTGLLGGAYLVPRGGQATLMVGYRGLVILAKRSGEVQRVEARVVRQKDGFEYAYGLDPYLRHTPSRDADPGELVYAYAVIVYRDGERQFDVMSKAEIEAIRGRSSAGRAGPWVTDYFEMAKKTVLRRLLKLAPLTVNVAAKLDELDPEVDEGPKPGAQGTRQVELQRELHEALEREYGTTPDAPRQLPAGATTQANGAGTPSGQAQGNAEAGAGAPAGAPAKAEAGTPASVPGAGAPAADPPQAAATCGATHAGLGAGPCVLVAAHQPGEHQEAGGTRWSNPNGVLHA